MTSTTPSLLTLIICLLGLPRYAAAEVRGFSGVQCTQHSPRGRAYHISTALVRPTFLPSGITNDSKSEDLLVLCPFTINPTLGVGLIEFGVWDRHSNYNFDCQVELFDMYGNSITTRTFASSGSSLDPMYHQVHLGGAKGSNLMMTCIIPRFHSEKGFSVLSGIQVYQQ
jgi:hypothetical protein